MYLQTTLVDYKLWDYGVWYHYLFTLVLKSPDGGVANYVYIYIYIYILHIIFSADPQTD